MKTKGLRCRVCMTDIVLGQMSVEVTLDDGRIFVPVHSRRGEKPGKTCVDELKRQEEAGSER